MKDKTVKLIKNVEWKKILKQDPKSIHHYEKKRGGGPWLHDNQEFPQLTMRSVSLKIIPCNVEGMTELYLFYNPNEIID